jgi:hypothetical protein
VAVAVAVEDGFGEGALVGPALGVCFALLVGRGAGVLVDSAAGREDGLAVARGTTVALGAGALVGAADEADVVLGDALGEARRCAATVSVGEDVGAEVAGGSCCGSAAGSASALAWAAIAADSAITDARDRPAETALVPRAGPTRRVEGRLLLTSCASARGGGRLLRVLVRPGERVRQPGTSGPHRSVQPIPSSPSSRRSSGRDSPTTFDGSPSTPSTKAAPSPSKVKAPATRRGSPVAT